MVVEYGVVGASYVDGGVSVDIDVVKGSFCGFEETVPKREEMEVGIG